MRYNLDQFLAESSLNFGQFKMRLLQLYHFETVVDYLLAALAKDGHKEIAVDLAPYFGCVWPSGLELAQQLVVEIASQELPKNMLELGCGLAIPSLIAAHFAIPVTAVDVNADALNLLKRNYSLNMFTSNMEAKLADWRLLNLNEKFDLIVASDVLYEEYHATSLAAVIERHLTPNGRFIVIDPCRWHYQHFSSAIEALGFRVQTSFAERSEAGRPIRLALIEGKVVR